LHSSDADGLLSIRGSCGGFTIQLPSGDIQATVLMIGEKASDMILESLASQQLTSKL
jgi:hypothetical protein